MPGRYSSWLRTAATPSSGTPILRIGLREVRAGDEGTHSCTSARSTTPSSRRTEEAQEVSLSVGTVPLREHLSDPYGEPIEGKLVSASKILCDGRCGHVATYKRGGDPFPRQRVHEACTVATTDHAASVMPSVPPSAPQRLNPADELESIRISRERPQRRVSPSLRP